MKKSDLKDGMIIKLNNNKFTVYTKEYLHGYSYVYPIYNWNEDLINKKDREYDIVEIYQINMHVEDIISYFKNNNDINNLLLNLIPIYKRNYQEITLIETIQYFAEGKTIQCELNNTIYIYKEYDCTYIDLDKNKIKKAK